MNVADKFPFMWDSHRTDGTCGNSKSLSCSQLKCVGCSQSESLWRQGSWNRGMVAYSNSKH